MSPFPLPGLIGVVVAICIFVYSWTLKSPTRRRFLGGIAVISLIFSATAPNMNAESAILFLLAYATFTLYIIRQTKVFTYAPGICIIVALILPIFV